MEETKIYILSEEEEKAVLGGNWVYDEDWDDWYWIE